MYNSENNHDDGETIICRPYSLQSSGVLVANRWQPSVTQILLYLIFSP